MKRFPTISSPVGNDLAAAISNLSVLVVMLVSLILGQPMTSSAEVTVNGSVETNGGQTILNLYGTNYEMGYAHGYLMAGKIRDIVDYFLIGVLAHGSVTTYNNFLATQAQYVTHFPQYLEEMNGIAAGMAASGNNLYVSRLGRNIDIRDIKALNLAPELSLMCGSFGVWGSATVNGETILARNMEFPFDSRGSLVNNQLIITYEPAGGTKFVSVSFPGIIGVPSGLNESGVSVMVNEGNVNNSTGDGPFHPSLEVFRAILESTTSANYMTQPLSIVNSVEEYTQFIIQVGSPYAESGNDPVYCLEDASGQNLIRTSANTNPGLDQIISSNHFLLAAPPLTSGDSLNDYNLMKNRLSTLYATGDGKVDSSEAWSILNELAGNDTLTTIIFRPNRMTFDVSFARLANGTLTLAPRLQPQTYAWADLFPNHGSTPPEPLADLVVQSIVANPAVPGPNQAVTVTVTVKNQGTAVAESFSLDFYKNQAAAPTSGQAGDGSCLKNNLAAGAADSCAFTVTSPATGSYSMWAQADRLQQVTELNESNNLAGPQTITVTRPDLVISSLTAPSTAKACQIVTVNDTTRNSGSSEAGPSVTRLYWSTSSGSISGAVDLGSRQVGALPAGTSSVGGISVTTPCGAAPGTYYIVARADAGGIVSETNEANNQASVAITISGPDLVVSSLTVPLYARACQVITVRDTTRNSSSFAAASSSTKFYWSTNSTGSGAILIGSRTIGALAAGASSSGSLSVQAPCGIATGRYYLIARADADNAVVESNENNNSSGRNIYTFR